MTAAAVSGAIMTAAFTLIGCSCHPPEDGDHFPCGVPQTDMPTMANVCDRPEERCICEGQRCALPDPVCNSGYRYSLGVRRLCVPYDRIHSALPTGLAAAAAFCPGEGPESRGCGRAGSPGCREEEVCSCELNECLRYAPACPLDYQDREAECVTNAAAVLPSQFLYRVDGGPSVCPAPPPLPCGIPLLGGEVRTCGAAAVCACALEEPTCVVRRADCASGYAFEHDPTQCVRDQTSREIEVSAPGAGGLCLDQVLPACGRPEAEPCPSDTECNCSDNRCVADDPGCDSELRYADGPRDCVVDAAARGGRVAFGGSCPAPLERPCGMDGPDGSPTACAGSDRCVCSQSRCAYSSEICGSGYAFADDYTCVTDEQLSANGGPPSDSGADGCPTGVECGGRAGAGRCGNDEVCVCRAERCARSDASCEPISSYAYVSTTSGDACVATADAHFDLLLTAPDGVCPGMGIELPCGVPGADLTGRTCEVGRCACDLNPSPRCVVELPRCATGWAFVHDRECVTETERALIENPTQAVLHAGICGDIPDGGVPDAGPPDTGMPDAGAADGGGE